MSKAEGRYLCQSCHPQVFDKILCSHFELKTKAATGEAYTQLKIWTSAGFEKQRRLRRQNFASTPDVILLPQPLWVWEKEKVELLVAATDWKGEQIWFIEHRAFLLDRSDKESLRKLIHVMSKIMEWGATTYIDWFRLELLNVDHLNPIRTRPG